MTQLQLGNFSISLSVSDLKKSKAFYSELGFEVIGGDEEQNWLVLQNEDTTIGLFQGMFDKNTLTFNPGWDSRGANLDSFTDVRELQQTLKSRGITPSQEVDESGEGPGFMVLEDPDGNPILIDQHV